MQTCSSWALEDWAASPDCCSDPFPSSASSTARARWSCCAATAIRRTARSSSDSTDQRVPLEALDWTIDLAAATGAPIVAVHATGLGANNAMMDSARQSLQEWCAPIEARAVSFEMRVESSDARAALEDVADATGASLLVVGTRGLGRGTADCCSAASPATSLDTPLGRSRSCLPSQADRAIVGDRTGGRHGGGRSGSPPSSPIVCAGPSWRRSPRCAVLAIRP